MNCKAFWAFFFFLLFHNEFIKLNKTVECWARVDRRLTCMQCGCQSYTGNDGQYGNTIQILHPLSRHHKNRRLRLTDIHFLKHVFEQNLVYDGGF